MSFEELDTEPPALKAAADLDIKVILPLSDIGSRKEQTDA